MDRVFDLISVYDASKSNPYFRVTFDYYTPRAHFVILASDDRAGDITELPRIQKVQSIQTAITARALFGLSEAAFSIHRGSWVTSRKFHTHLCTDVDAYVKIYEAISSRPPMSTWWPSQDFVTGQWKSSKNCRRYVDNVRGYPYKSYKERLSDADLADPDHCMTSFEGKPLAYHGSRRRIGLCYGKCDVTDADGVCNLVMALDQLANHIGAKSGREGCHLVVDLTGKGFPGFETEEIVFGYLEVSGIVFYKNCPPRQRRRWLKNYNSLSDDKVLT